MYNRDRKEMIMDHFRDKPSICSHMRRFRALHKRLGVLLAEVIFGASGKAYIKHGKVKKQTA